MEADDPWEWRLIFLCLFHTVFTAWHFSLKCPEKEGTFTRYRCYENELFGALAKSCIWPLSFPIQKLISQLGHHPLLLFFPPGIWRFNMLHLRLTSTRGKREGTLQTKQVCRLLSTQDLVWQQANANISVRGLGLCEFGGQANNWGWRWE